MLPLLVLALVAQGVGAPVCPRVAVSHAKCGLQAPKSHPWSTSYVYHSAKAFASLSSKKQLFEELLPAEPCKSTLTLDRSGPVKDFPSRFFASASKSNTSSSGSTWANTPEGEWTVLVDNGQSLQARLRLDKGAGCRLHSVSVYRPSGESLALRLNFAGCHDGSDVVHVALEIHVQRAEGEGGSSNLAEWMCSLMDHEACWPMQSAKATAAASAARRLTAPLEAFSTVGLGRCVSRGPHPPEQRDAAGTLERCAQECIRKGRSQRPDDVAGCRGFAFSERHPHCMLYSDFAAPSNAQQLYASGDWGCYAISGASGQVEDTHATAHRQVTTPPAYLAPLRVALKGSGPLRLPTALDLRGELGQSWHPAMRRRLEPLKRGCYEPFEWIVLDPEPQSKVTLNATAWDLITQHLPIVAAPALEMESALAADRVCVSLGGSAAPGKPAAAEEADPAGASKEKAKCVPLSQLSPAEPAPQPWKLFVASLASAIIAAVVTVVIMDERIRGPCLKGLAVMYEGLAGLCSQVCQYVVCPTAEDILHLDEKLPCSRGGAEADQPLLEMAGAGADKSPASLASPDSGRPDEKTLKDLRSQLTASQPRKGPSRPAFSPALNAALAPPTLAGGGEGGPSPRP